MTEAPQPQLSRRNFLKIFMRTLAGGSLCSLGVVYYGTRVEPWWLEVVELRITLPDLPPSFEGYRLIQLTDLHVADPDSREVVSNAIQAALELAPDMIVLTGDYITDELDPKLYEVLNPLNALDGVWAVLGNHDYKTDAPGVRRVLADVGIGELANRNVPITQEDQTIFVAGVDDIAAGMHDLDQALDGIPSGSVVILLAHEPDYADEVYPTERVALQLSGHSHGGQVRLFGIGERMTPGLARKYPYGLRRLGAMWLYTSRGAGYLTPLRLNCRPEVTVITLTQKVVGQQGK